MGQSLISLIKKQRYLYSPTVSIPWFKLISCPTYCDDSSPLHNERTIDSFLKDEGQRNGGRRSWTSENGIQTRVEVSILALKGYWCADMVDLLKTRVGSSTGAFKHFTARVLLAFNASHRISGCAMRSFCSWTRETEPFVFPGVFLHHFRHNWHPITIFIRFGE